MNRKTELHREAKPQPEAELQREAQLRLAIGAADTCELLSAGLAFPTRELAAALASGAFADDAASCLADLGASDHAMAQAAELLAPFQGRPAEELFEALRKGHSILFLAPGAHVPVWPYESAFRFTEAGMEGTPSLFRSACTIDVERHMRESGVLPKDARKEPADSVWNELSFLSFLFGNLAESLRKEKEAGVDANADADADANASAIESASSCASTDADANTWRKHIAAFWDEHASQWLPVFFQRTQTEAVAQKFGSEYKALASFGMTAYDALNASVTLLR